ncbi:MAG: serine/threonine protein kinase [Verrucomicrobiales bacterium]|jgi:serine/threonine protein kinase
MSERYTIKGKIGQGGVGAVYRAFDNTLKRDVAIKRLLSQGEPLKDQQRTAERLVKEAGMLSKLQHPNIVSVFDVGIDDDGGYVVMELIEGETFDVTIRRGALTAIDFAQVVEQTLEAMIAAQQIDMLHRDLKPSNLMVSWLPSGRFQVKVLDFGLAKLSQAPALQTINQGDAIMGSIYFMAPEQFDRELLDGRTDLYSLGCLYYYGLAGRYPFDGAEAPNVMIAHIEHDVTPLAKLRPDLPQEVCDWVMRLISKDKNDRPASANAAAKEFEPALAAINRAANPLLNTAEIPAAPSPEPSPNRPRLITGPVEQLQSYPPPLHTSGYQRHQIKKKSPALAISLWTLAALVFAGLCWILFEEKGQAEPPAPKNEIAAPSLEETKTLEAPPEVTRAYLPTRVGTKNHPIPQRLVFFNSRWRYAETEIVEESWIRPAFDDSGWKAGKSPLGFGEENILTEFDKQDSFITYYLRKSIKLQNVPAASNTGEFVARFQYDDGFRLYLNGKELLRKNLPKGEIKHTTLAASRGSQENEGAFVAFKIPHGTITNGENVFAVEIHQTNTTSSDLRFAMVLDFVVEGTLPPKPNG